MIIVLVIQVLRVEDQSMHESIFSLEMEQPLVSVWAVSSDGLTYNVYVEKGSGLWEELTHGIIGKEKVCGSRSL